MQVRLTTPLTRQELAPLHAGDTVLLTGTVYTARDAAHARMNEALDRGEPLPFDIKGAAIYYVGPTPERPGCAIGAAGPTTSGRMDKFTPRLLDLGLACMIGKGKRDEAVKAAVVRNGAVYLAAIGRCPDGWQRKKLRDHRLAGPWVRGCSPPGSGGYAPYRSAGCPWRRPVPVRPAGIPAKPDLIRNLI